MEKIENKPNIKDSKARSRLYPRYDLEEAIRLIQVVSKLGRKNISERSVAAETGKSMVNSGFLGRVSSAKQFGLISKDGGKLSLTQLGKEIMFPQDDAIKALAIKRAFIAPMLYKELVDAFNGNKIPEYSSLGNRLINDYGIEAGAKDLAAKNFIKSAEYSGVIRNGILIIESEFVMQPGAGQESSSFISDIKNASQGVKNQSTRTDDMMFEFSGGMKLVIPRHKKTEEAVMDGELKGVRKLLTEFAENFVTKADNIKDKVSSNEII